MKRVILFTIFVVMVFSADLTFQVRADGSDFSALYTFEAAAPVTFTSPLGSQPDTRPVLGPDNTVYGMTFDGGANGNGVIYRFDLESKQYTVLHTFSALDANGNNEDGANPGVALTRGPDDVFYGMASFGGQNGNGTIFKITTSGEFTVLHTFSALDANAQNEDGANPLRTLVIGEHGSLYGTTRLGGQNTCGLKPNVVEVVHDFGGLNSNGDNSDGANPIARLTLGHDGTMYSTASNGGMNGNGVVYRIRPDGDFKVLHTFSATDPTTGANKDGATPDYGVVLGRLSREGDSDEHDRRDDEDNSLIGIADYGGNGSSAGFFNSGGTLYQLKLDDRDDRDD